MATSSSETLAVHESLTAIGEQLVLLCWQLQTTLEQTARIVDAHTSSAQLEKPIESDAPLVEPRDDWDAIVFGSQWADDVDLEPDRRRLFAGLSSSSEAALGFVGRLMIFRAARREQLPPLLKEIGEAFYEWRSQETDVSDLFLDCLTHWLERRCAAVGLRHKIELVNAGDRFDRSRHHAVATGLDVSEVRGWIVLRDDGTIYTRALVIAN